MAVGVDFWGLLGSGCLANIVQMKVISYNIRGLGRRVKKRELKELVRMQTTDMLCIQETKLVGVDRRLCSLILEGNEFEWVSKDADGRSRGLVVIWKKGCFDLLSVFSESNFLGIEGWWGKDRVKVSMVMPPVI